MNTRKTGVFVVAAACVLLVIGVWCLEAAGTFSLPTLASDDDITVEMFYPYSGQAYWAHHFGLITGSHDVENYVLGPPAEENVYQGWCVDVESTASPGKEYGKGPTGHFVSLYLTYGWLNCPDIYNEGPSGDSRFRDKFHLDDADVQVRWQKVNWILNHLATYSWQEIQCAIWGFMDGQVPPSQNSYEVDLYAADDCDQCNELPDAQTLYEAAAAAGAGFEPDAGDQVAVAVYVASGDEVIQATIVSVLTTVDIPVEFSSFNAASEDGNMVLQWVTQTETENLGFYVYRSLEKEGKYQQITPVLLEGSGSSWTPRIYEFVDREVESGKTYYYKLEQVDFSGAMEMYGPVTGTVVAKPALPTSTWGQVKALLK